MNFHTKGSQVVAKAQKCSSLGRLEGTGLNPPVVAFKGIWNNNRLSDFLLRTDFTHSNSSSEHVACLNVFEQVNE